MNQILAQLKSTIVELAGSKKALTLAASGVATLLLHAAAKQGWTWLDPETANAVSTKIMAAVAAYLVGQGIADHGKEAVLAAPQAFSGSYAASATPSAPEPSKN